MEMQKKTHSSHSTQPHTHPEKLLPIYLNVVKFLIFHRRQADRWTEWLPFSNRWCVCVSAAAAAAVIMTFNFHCWNCSHKRYQKWERRTTYWPAWPIEWFFVMSGVLFCVTDAWMKIDYVHHSRPFVKSEPSACSVVTCWPDRKCVKSMTLRKKVTHFFGSNRFALL